MFFVATDAMEDVKEGKDFKFSEEEENIMQLWQNINAFEEQLRRSEGRPECANLFFFPLFSLPCCSPFAANLTVLTFCRFIFFDGPPFATGLPHYGHILAGTIKVFMNKCNASSTMNNDCRNSPHRRMS